MLDRVIKARCPQRLLSSLVSNYNVHKFTGLKKNNMNT